MKNKIKEIHNKLSFSKIESFDSVINTDSFSSVLKDRFVSELKKMDVYWNLEPTTINKLVKNEKIGKTDTVISKSSITETNLENGMHVGVDLQFIGDLPTVKDPWEDQFYIDNFNKNEIAHCLKKKNIYESFAGIFAIKEAIYKIDGTSKKDIKLKFSKEGKPINDKYSISISHDHNYALGVAILNIEKTQLKEIKELKTKIDNNNKLLKKIEIKSISISKKSYKDYILYFLIIFIFCYTLIRDFLFQ